MRFLEEWETLQDLDISWKCCVLSWGGKSNFAFMLHDIVCLNVKLSFPAQIFSALERDSCSSSWGGGGGWSPWHTCLCSSPLSGGDSGVQHRDPVGPPQRPVWPMFLQPQGRPNVSSDTHLVSQLRTMSAILGPVWNSSHILVEGKAAGAGDRHGLIPGVNLSKPFNVSGLQGLPLF